MYYFSVMQILEPIEDLEYIIFNLGLAELPLTF